MLKLKFSWAFIVCQILPVIWSETVSLTTRAVWDQEHWSWSCTSGGVVKQGLVTLVVIMILKDTATSQVFIVSLVCTWNITTAEMNSGVHLLKS